MKLYCTFLFFLIGVLAIAQGGKELNWYDVGEMELEGQPKGAVSNPFQRFPDSMKDKVRQPVWELSENPAGLQLNFTTNASEIIVTYETEGDLGFPHMPPTGVSGIDLYVKKENESWHWAKGNFSFGDTITYMFKVHPGQKKNSVSEFALYLPLYTTVKWMKIGIDKNASLDGLPLTEKLPVVVYGTSITQGACAGRPGTTWTSRLSRKIDRPVLNLGFSGNGRLEEEVIRYISELQARVIILDCLANFTSGQGLNAEEAKKRLIQSVKEIRKFNPVTPIILTDHAGYPHGEFLSSAKEMFSTLNRANSEAYELLKKEGVGNLYILEKKDLNLDMDDFVDGVHPNDSGMKKYAEAYFVILAEIFDSWE